MARGQGAILAMDKQSGNWASWASAFANRCWSETYKQRIFDWTDLKKLQKMEHTQRPAAIYTLRIWPCKAERFIQCMFMAKKQSEKAWFSIVILSKFSLSSTCSSWGTETIWNPSACEFLWLKLFTLACSTHSLVRNEFRVLHITYDVWSKSESTDIFFRISLA